MTTQVLTQFRSKSNQDTKLQLGIRLDDSIIVANFWRSDRSLSFQDFCTTDQHVPLIFIEMFACLVLILLLKNSLCKFVGKLCSEVFFTLHNTFFNISLWMRLQMSRATCHLFSVSAKDHRLWSCLEVNFHYEHPCVLCVSQGVKLDSNFECDFGLESRKKTRGHGNESVGRDFSEIFGAQTKKSSVKCWR